MAFIESLMSTLSPQLLLKRVSREVGQLDKRFADCTAASMGADEAKFSGAAQVLSGYRDRLADIARSSGDGSHTTSADLLARLRLARLAQDPLLDAPQGEAGIRSALVTAYQARKVSLPIVPAGEPVSNFVSQESALDHGTTIVPATDTSFIDAENALNHPTTPLPATNSSFASQEAALNGFTSQGDNFAHGLPVQQVRGGAMRGPDGIC